MRGARLVRTPGPLLIFGFIAARSSAAAGRGDYNSIVGFAAGQVNGTDALVCNSAWRSSAYRRGPKGKELKSWGEHWARKGFCALVLDQSALRRERTRASVQTLYSSDTARAMIGVTFIASKVGRRCHRRVWILSKDCTFVRGCYAMAWRWICDASSFWRRGFRQLYGGS